MGKRQKAALETRQKLIDAVKKLSETKPYNEMSIDDITRTAGVAKGTFYTYFKRKEDIICVVSYETLEQVIKKVSDGNVDVAERIARFLNDSALIIEGTTLEASQQWCRSIVSPLENDTLGTDKLDFDRGFIEGCLRSAVDSGVLRSDTPIFQISMQIISEYYGAVALWCMSNGKISHSEIIKDFCTGGLPEIINAYRKRLTE